MTDIRLKSRLGKGGQGEVWSTTSGAVVKLTRSKEEAAICDQIRKLQGAGIELPHLPKILAVGRSGSEFAILREDVPSLKSLEGYEDVLADFNDGWFFGEESKLNDAFDEMSHLASVHRDLQTLRNLTQIELWDLSNPDNYGGDLDRLIIRDVGTGSVGPELFDQITWDEMMIIGSEDPDPEPPFDPLELEP